MLKFGRASISILKKLFHFNKTKKDIFHLNSLQKVVEIAEKEFRN